MSDHTAHFDIADAQTIEQLSDVGYRIPIRGELGFQHPDTDIRFVYRESTRTLYALVATHDGGLHIFEEKSFLRNSWERVSPDGGYPFGTSGGANINQPLRTQEDTLLIFDNGDSVIRRSEDWGETEPDVVWSDATGLCTRHSQDVFGDIFIAEYTGRSQGAHRVIRSTDDGRSWDVITTQLGESHMHFCVAAPRQDLVVFSSGHDDVEMEVCRKDGSRHDNVQLFPNGANNTQPGSAMPIEISAPGGWDAGLTIFVGHDSVRSIISRSLIGIDSGGSAFSNPQYGIVQDGNLVRRSPYVADIDLIDGHVVALSRTGNLHVSPDGYFWERIPVTIAQTDKFMNFFAETENHLIVEGLDPIAIPKRRLQAVDPRKQSYSVTPRSPPAPVAGGEAFMQYLPIDNVEKLRVAGVGSGALQLTTNTGGTRQYTELIDFGSGSRQTNELELYGQTIEEIAADGSVDDTIQFSVELFKR